MGQETIDFILLFLVAQHSFDHIAKGQAAASYHGERTVAFETLVHVNDPAFTVSAYGGPLPYVPR